MATTNRNTQLELVKEDYMHVTIKGCREGWGQNKQNSFIAVWFVILVKLELLNRAGGNETRPLITCILGVLLKKLKSKKRGSLV